MVAQAGPLKTSSNAGELSDELKGRVDIKQYYAAGLRFKNIEPVPQSGFRLMPGTALVDEGRAANCRHATLKVSPDLSYTLIVTVGWCDIYRNDRVKVASVQIPEITTARLPEITFYGEANTFGIFHEDFRTRRLFRDESDDTSWTVDNWPYETVPEVDLGGDYAKTDDRWDVWIRWAEATRIYLSLTIDGEQTEAIAVPDSQGNDASVPTDADWDTFASLLQDAVNGLPSIPGGVTVTHAGGGEHRRIAFTFGGASSGREYGFSAIVTNTSAASALPTHFKIGKTDGEPLISASKGWFAGMELIQDRAAYFAPKAIPAAVLMSETAEYFDLNIESQADTAAILNRLRTETSERVLAIYEGKYPLLFTQQAEWFATNRVISRNEPMNWVRASKNGIRPNCPPVEMEGIVYYVSGRKSEDSNQGQILYSANYDDVSTSYNSNPESLLASHLVQDIEATALQDKIRRNDAARWWLKDSSGRLICALTIRNQDILLAMCEWIAAAGGKVRGISVDGQNQCWVTIQRGDVITVEVMEEMEINLFQGAVKGGTDLAGRFDGLDLWEGLEVWARADGYILGPFTVQDGAIDLGDPYDSVTAGLWQPPLHESMPYIRVLPNDQIVRRPGRIHSAKIAIIETESIAVGANGGKPRNVPLLKVNDPLDRPMPAKTDYATVAGMPGMVMDPTLVITQTRPGRLRVRDYTPEASL